MNIIKRDCCPLQLHDNRTAEFLVPFKTYIIYTVILVSKSETSCEDRMNSWNSWWKAQVGFFCAFWHIFRWSAMFFDWVIIGAHTMKSTVDVRMKLALKLRTRNSWQSHCDLFYFVEWEVCASNTYFFYYYRRTIYTHCVTDTTLSDRKTFSRHFNVLRINYMR